VALFSTERAGRKTAIVAKFNHEVGDRARKKLLGHVLGYEAWLVKSWIVREYESEFASGGNNGRYPEFIPDEEIWLEVGLDLVPYDLCGVVIHEALEAEIMRLSGMEYNQAHEMADFYEKRFREFVVSVGYTESWDVASAADAFCRIYMKEIEK
jgi:hypothetical protein